MEKLYLNANLMGLINNLKQYASEEDVMKFICNVDLINNQNEHMLYLYHKKIDMAVKEIYHFLLKTYIVKLKIQYDNKIISGDMFIKNVKNYFASLGRTVKLYHQTYVYFTENSLIEVLQSIKNSHKTL